MSGETPTASVELPVRAAPALPVRASPERVARAGALGVLVLIAFTLRLIPVVFVPSLNWGDEVFQTTEQAHRLVYGTGLVPWEFQLGTRSWLLPGVLAGVMQFARLVGEGPDTYLPVIAGACGLLAVIPVACCFLWCRRWFGLTGAIVGGLAVAVAPELVYFGDRTLNEVVAAHLLVLALYLLEPGYRVTSHTRLFWAGAIVALVFVLRIQLGPAVALIAIWTTLRGSRARLLNVAGGIASALGFVALLDAVTLGYPFASIWRNVRSVQPVFRRELVIWTRPVVSIRHFRAGGLERRFLRAAGPCFVGSAPNGPAVCGGAGHHRRAFGHRPQGIPVHLPGRGAARGRRGNRVGPTRELGTTAAEARRAMAGFCRDSIGGRHRRGLVSAVVSGVDRPGDGCPPLPSA
jgi:hypothetical protein